MNPIHKAANLAKEQKQIYENILSEKSYVGLNITRTKVIDLIGYYRGKQEAFEMMAEMMEKYQ